jgi:hypothetical protein
MGRSCMRLSVRIFHLRNRMSMKFGTLDMAQELLIVAQANNPILTGR